MPLKPKYKNHLALIRKKKAIAQKQIATLLGHKTNDQISRYELGAKLPTLKTALKLGIIYNLPLQTLFYGYYEICQKEIDGRKNNSNGKAIDSTDTFNAGGGAAEDIEFCTIAEKLKPFNVSNPALDEARSHISKLVSARADRMNHR